MFWALRLFCCSLLLFGVSCNKPPDVSNQQPEPAATPSATPAATTSQETPPSTTPEPVTKRRAPEGVLYLIKRAMIPTEDGVTGIPVGAEVKVLVPQEGGKIRVEYKGNPLILPASQLTNDLDLVASLTKPAAKPATPQAVAPGTSTAKAPASQAELEAKREASVRETRAKQFESAIPQAEHRIAEIEEEMQVSMRSGNRAFVNGQVVPNDNIENRGRRSQIAALRSQIAVWRNEISSLRRGSP